MNKMRPAILRKLKAIINNVGGDLDYLDEAADILARWYLRGEKTSARVLKTKWIDFYDEVWTLMIRAPTVEEYNTVASFFEDPLLTEGELTQEQIENMQ